MPARPEDALPLFTSAIYTPTEEERAPHLPEVKHYHGEIAPITGPLTGAASALSTEAPCDCNDGAPHYPCDHEVRSQFTPLNPEGRP